MSIRCSADRRRSCRGTRPLHAKPLLRTLGGAAAAVAAAALTPALAFGTDGTWSLNGDGSWGTAGNWTTNPSLPNGVGDAARFLNVITANHTVTQDVTNLTLGQIEFNDNNSYLLSGSAITFDVAAGNAAVTVNTSNGSASHTISSNLVLNDALAVTTNAVASFPLTFSGAISGTGGLVKSGLGTLSIRGPAANTFTGTVSVNEGTLELVKGVTATAIGGNLVIGDDLGGANADVATTSNGAVPDMATVTVNSSGQFQVIGGDVIKSLVLKGGSTTIAGGGTFLQIGTDITTVAHANSSTIGGVGPLDIPSSAIINVADGAAADDLLISVQVGGTNLTKQGAGTLVVSAENTYGITTISSGTLQIGNGGITGSLGFNPSVTDNGTLAFKRSNSLTMSQNISGSGNLVQAGSGQTILLGNNTYTGTTTVTAGLLQVGNNGTTGKLGTGDIVVGPGATLAIYHTDAVTLAQNISGDGSVQNYGGGTTNLTGAVSFTGPIAVNAGKLILNNSMPSIYSIYCSGNGVLQLASNGSRVMKAGSVLTANTGKLDITNNKLILTQESTGAWNGAAYTGNTGHLVAGRNGGAWNGSGIITTSATPFNDYTTLGVASAADAKGLSGTATDTFAGQTVHATDTLVMYTYGGDATLDGQINIDDYTQIDSSVSVGGALKGWFNGDFNYDGNVDIDDYTIIDSNIAIQGAPFSNGGGEFAGGVAAVPEPTAVWVVWIVGGTGVARRRRRRPTKERLIGRGGGDRST